jgi:hypothetical protein
MRRIVGFAVVCLLSLPILSARNEPASVNPISSFNRAVERGVNLAYDPATGYLRSVLQYLNVPIESQIAVFSKTSFQGKLVDQQNPRVVYFNDDVAIAWVRGSSTIEAAALDAGTGVAFYEFEQGQTQKPYFRRDDSCLTCHQSQRTLGVPGLFTLSTPPDREEGGSVSDHRTPFAGRWGGWYVTGQSSRFRHLGNRPGQGWLRSLYDQFDTSGYLTEYSDIVALMTFEHQTQAVNLITRLARAARTGESGQRMQEQVDALVDYLLFIDEAPLPSRIIGTSGFREEFEALGPFDRKGRSLRSFDLTKRDLHGRMMRYPCSYTIYSQAFNALPVAARQLVYARMWGILSGRIDDPKYAGISHADREAVIEILHDTKQDLPSYFAGE